VLAPITEYTTPSEVRAVLGVNVDELPDATLALPMYARALQAALEGIAVDLPTDYATIAAKVEGDRTVPEQRVFDTAALYATYQIAVQLASSLPIFSPKQITDGKSGFSRYADSPYKEAVREARAKYEEYAKLLGTHYGAFNGTGTTVTRSYFSGAQPTSDPVTGT
jgi:hypothetical protein